jgi:hypothetical protein
MTMANLTLELVKFTDLVVVKMANRFYNAYLSWRMDYYIVFYNMQKQFRFVDFNHAWLAVSVL